MFLPMIQTAIPEIIILLKDSNWNVRIAAADTLSKLSDHSKRLYLSGLSLLIYFIAGFQLLIMTAIPEIITLLKDSYIHVQIAAANTLSKLSDHSKRLYLSGLSLLIYFIAGFQPLIMTAIPEIITLLKDSHSVQIAAANTLSKLSDHSKRLYLSALSLLIYFIAGFQPLIMTAIPEIITLLNDSDSNVRIAAANTLSKLSDHCKRLYLSGLSLLIYFVAGFQPLIMTAIPEIITLLKDSDSDVQIAAANTLSKLSDHSKRLYLSGLSLLIYFVAGFQPLIMTAIPEIITLLKDSDSDVQIAAANTLSKLSDHSKRLYLSGLSLLIYFIAGFQPLIMTAIPEIITLLKDSDSDVQIAAANTLSKLSDHSKRLYLSGLSLLIYFIAGFQPLIMIAIPAIITLLKDSSVQIVAANTLSELSDHSKRLYLSGLSLLIYFIAGFQPLIMTAIPEIITLLKDSYWKVRTAAADTLSKLSDHSNRLYLSGLSLLIYFIAGFQPLIMTAIPEIITLLKDSYWKVRIAAADTLSKLSDHSNRLYLSGLSLLIYF